MMKMQTPREMVQILRDKGSIGDGSPIVERVDLDDGWQVRVAAERKSDDLGRVAFGEHIDAWVELVPPASSASDDPVPEGYVTPVALGHQGRIWSRDGGKTWGAAVRGGPVIANGVSRAEAIAACRDLDQSRRPYWSR